MDSLVELVILDCQTYEQTFFSVDSEEQLLQPGQGPELATVPVQS